MCLPGQVDIIFALPGQVTQGGWPGRHIFLSTWPGSRGGYLSASPPFIFLLYFSTFRLLRSTSPFNFLLCNDYHLLIFNQKVLTSERVVGAVLPGFADCIAAGHPPVVLEQSWHAIGQRIAFSLKKA